jgi:hypothetical protein
VGFILSRTGSPDSVDVILKVIHWKLVVDHSLNAFDVQASRSNIRCLHVCRKNDGGSEKRTKNNKRSFEVQNEWWFARTLRTQAAAAEKLGELGNRRHFA